MWPFNKKEQKRNYTIPPHILADALQYRIHAVSGRLLKSEHIDTKQNRGISNKQEPLPCPFCGEPPCVYESSDGWWIDCDNDYCDVQPVLQRPSHKKHDAISNWNTRIGNAKTTCTAQNAENP